MAIKSETAVSKHLAWAFLQGWVFMPGVLGLHFEDMRHAGWQSWTLAVGLLGFVGSLLLRNLMRMWRAPAGEASKWHVAPLFAVGVLFGLMASGPLIERSASAKVTGFVYAVLSASILVLAIREVARLRRARPTNPVVV